MPGGELTAEAAHGACCVRQIREQLRVVLSLAAEDAALEETLCCVVELDDTMLERLARAVLALQRAFRARRDRAAKRKSAPRNAPALTDADAMDMLEESFRGMPCKGYVIYLCGSTGIVGDSFRYLRMMAGMGFVVIAPDMMVSAAVKGSTLRTRQPKGCMLLDSAASDYWSPISLYEDKASCAGELVYSSQAEKFMSDPEAFNRMYSNIITLRQAELAHIMRLLPDMIRRKGVVLVGSSEGAVCLTSFQDEPFIDLINGRVILAYPCENNYWTYFRPEDAGIAGDPMVPTLNLVGCDDQYFGRRDSVAAKVAEASDLPPPRGHAFDAMVERGLTHGLVCHFEGAVHTLLKTHDSVVREVFLDFLERPFFACRKLPVHWERIPHLRNHIRRYRRYQQGPCHVLYVRFCKPPNAGIHTIDDSEPRKTLLARIDRVIYEGARAAGKKGDKQSPVKLALTSDEQFSSIISAVHTSQDVSRVHTSVSLTEKQPEFVDKVEEQLEELKNEELPGRIVFPNSDIEPNAMESPADETGTLPAPPPVSVLSVEPVANGSENGQGIRIIKREVHKPAAVSTVAHHAAPPAAKRGAAATRRQVVAMAEPPQAGRPVSEAARSAPAEMQALQLGIASRDMADAIRAHGRDVRTGLMVLAGSFLCGVLALVVSPRRGRDERCCTSRSSG